MNRSFPLTKGQTHLSKQIWLASLNSLTAATVLITQVPIYYWSSFFQYWVNLGMFFVLQTWNFISCYGMLSYEVI